MSEFEQGNLRIFRKSGENVSQKKLEKPLFLNIEQHNNILQQKPNNLLNASIDDHVKLLKDAQSERYFTDIATDLQHAFGNNYVQRVFERMKTQHMNEHKAANTHLQTNYRAITGEPAASEPGDQAEEEKRLSNQEEESAKIGRLRSGWYFFNIGKVVDDPINPHPQSNVGGSAGFEIRVDETVYAEQTPGLGVGEETWTTSELFKVRLNELTLHIMISIWPPDSDRFRAIEEFGYYYGGPYNQEFQTYDGVLLHENVHRKQYIQFWEKHYPVFVTGVNSIIASNSADAQDEFNKLEIELRQNMEADKLNQATEEEPCRLEWEYYHRQYDALSHSPAESLSVPE